MRVRQARKIVKIVRYTPIDRMSDKWFDRALQYAVYNRQSQIEKAERCYWQGVDDGLIKPFNRKLERDKYII